MVICLLASFVPKVCTPISSNRVLGWVFAMRLPYCRMTKYTRARARLFEWRAPANKDLSAYKGRL
eukprot:8285917-Pyramimonas_sp.AAC.2